MFERGNVEETPRLKMISAVTRLLYRPWLPNVSMMDRRFRWFVARFEPFIGADAPLLAKLLDQLTISDDVVEAIGFPIVEELCEHLSNYGDYLSSMTVEEELFSILATVANDQQLPFILDAFGWTGDATSSLKTSIAPGSLAPEAAASAARQAKMTLEAMPFWTPALDRAAERAGAYPNASPEGVVNELNRVGIVEHKTFDPDGLALAFQLLRPAVPSVFRAARMDLDALWSKRTRAKRIVPVAADHLISRAIAREFLNPRADEYDERPTSTNSADDARALEIRIQDMLDHRPPHATRSGQSPDAAVDWRLSQAIARISAWAAVECRAKTVGEALECIRTAESPPFEVHQAWTDLREIDVNDAGTAFRPIYDPVAVVARIEQSFDSNPEALVRGQAVDCVRMWRILNRRVLTTKPLATLEELGQELGLTRERVRQVEVKARDAFLRVVADRASAPLARAAWRARADLGPAVPDTEWRRYYSSQFDFDTASDALVDLTGRCVLWLAGPYRQTSDGWLVIGKTGELADESNALLWSATMDGPILEDAAVTTLSIELGIKPIHARAWITSLGRYRFQDGWLSRWSGSFADKAEQILLLAGEPLSRDEIAERVGGQVSRGPIGLLPADPRFLRVSLTQIGLREWGLDEYSTIEEELAKEIERQGGNATVAQLTETLVRKFGVAEQSVRLYLTNGTGFSRGIDGAYRNIPAETVARQVKAIDLSRACFFDGAHWAYRHEVTAETLRGSGSPISTSFAVYMGADEQGNAVQLDTPFGPVRINRTTTMTTISTLRAIANAFSAEPGDYLFLRRSGADSLGVAHTPASVRKGRSGFPRLAIECGLATVETASMADICMAVGLAPDSTPDVLVERLRRRMEFPLIPFIPS